MDLIYIFAIFTHNGKSGFSRGKILGNYSTKREILYRHLIAVCFFQLMFIS